MGCNFLTKNCILPGMMNQIFIKLMNIVRTKHVDHEMKTFRPLVGEFQEFQPPFQPRSQGPFSNSRSRERTLGTRLPPSSTSQFFFVSLPSNLRDSVIQDGARS